MATPIKTPNNTWRIRVGWTDENGVKQVKCKSGFPTANKAILWAVEEGITTGYAGGTFRPNNVCTRGNIVTFLYRAYN